MASNMLKYKDFYGSVEYSSNDECFFGKAAKGFLFCPFLKKSLGQ